MTDIKCCPVLLLLSQRAAAYQTAVALLPPLDVSALSLNVFFFSKRAISKRAPQATVIFLTMALYSWVSGCGCFLVTSDVTIAVWLSCYQHPEAALVDESCSHCRNMTSRCCGPKTSSSNEWISPLPCPVLVLPSLSSGGLLRLMVRVI